jgi:hypothetical protein
MFESPKFKPGQGVGMNINGVTRMSASFSRKFAGFMAEIRRVGRIKVLPPIKFRDGEDRTIAIGLQPEMWAKLSGASNPYSFTEQHFDTSTGFSDMDGGRTGTSNAYEANSRAGLTGKIVKLYYEDQSTDWRFQYLGLGPPPCDPGTTTATATVKGCGGFFYPGAIFGVTGPAGFSASATTDGSGFASIGLPYLGVYNWTLTPGSGSQGLQTISGSFTKAVCGSNTAVVVNTWPVLSGHHCCGNKVAWPSTISVTSAGGTQTGTWQAGFGLGTWTTPGGSVNMPDTIGYVIIPLPSPGVVSQWCGAAPAAGDVAWGLSVTCGSVGVGWRGNCCGPSDPGYIPASAGCHNMVVPASETRTGSNVSNVIPTPSGGAEQTLPFTVTASSTDDSGNFPNPIPGSIVVDF